MTAPNFYATMPALRRGIASGYDLITGAPTFLNAVHLKDKETITEVLLRLARSSFRCIEAHSSFITAVSCIASRFCSYEFFHRPHFVVTPFAANALGLTACSIDALIEFRGVIRCNQFLDKNFSSDHSNLLLSLQETAAIENPIEKREKRLELIKTILPLLKPTSLTRKIQSIFKEVVERETKKPEPIPESNPLPLEKNITYEELEKKIEIATCLTRLEQFKTSYISVSPEKKEAISNLAKANFPTMIKKRESVILKLIAREEEKKTFALNRFLGESFTKKLKESIDPLLKNLLSKNESISEEALLKTKELLENTETQVKKMRFIHIIGFYGAALSAISFLVAMILFCPPLVILLIGISGTILYTIRYVIACELLENQGWSFSLKSALHRAFIDPVKENLVDPLREKTANIRRSLFGDPSPVSAV